MPTEEPRLTRGELWLLTSVVELRLDVRTTARDQDNLEALLNHRAHLLDRSDLVDAFASLFARGWLSAHREGRRLPPLDASAVRRALDEPSRGRTAAQTTAYQLTAAGGAVWERFTRPDWNYFVGFDGDCAPGRIQRVRLTCADDAFLRREFERVYGRWHLGEPRWRSVGRWRPTYWETLPAGVRVTFRTFDQTQAPFGTPIEHLSNRWYAPRW